MIRQAAKYGAVSGLAVAHVGGIAGMGGGLAANLIFGAAMGAFAGRCDPVAMRIGGGAG